MKLNTFIKYEMILYKRKMLNQIKYVATDLFQIHFNAQTYSTL